MSDTYKLKLLQSKYDELLAAFDDVHQRLTAFEAENEKLRAAQEQLGLFLVEINGRGYYVPEPVLREIQKLRTTYAPQPPH